MFPQNGYAICFALGGRAIGKNVTHMFEEIIYDFNNIRNGSMTCGVKSRYSMLLANRFLPVELCMHVEMRMIVQWIAMEKFWFFLLAGLKCLLILVPRN